jgi:hypothetical protein
MRLAHGKRKEKIYLLFALCVAEKNEVKVAKNGKTWPPLLTPERTILSKYDVSAIFLLHSKSHREKNAVGM